MSVVDSGCFFIWAVSFHLGLSIVKGVSREESSSITSVCLVWISTRYSSFGGSADCRGCWSCSHFSLCNFGSGAWECQHSRATQYNPRIMFQMQKIFTKMPVKMSKQNTLHRVSTNCTLNGMMHSKKYTKVIQYVTKNS